MAARWDADGKRVIAEGRRDAAGRCEDQRSIRGAKSDKPVLGRLPHIMAGGPKMIGPPYADDANALLARLAHGNIHGDHADPLARAIVPIDLRGTGRLALDLHARSGIDLAGCDPRCVARDADHVVRRLTAQACLELHLGYDLGALPAQSRSGQSLAAKGAEALDGDQSSEPRLSRDAPRLERLGSLPVSSSMTTRASSAMV